MATIRPFKGLRPPRELVERVASRPYDVLNSDEARQETSPSAPTNTTNACTARPPKTSNCGKTAAGWCKTRKNITISMPRQ